MKIELPALTEPLTHSSVNIWLGALQDSFEAMEILDSHAATLTEQQRINLCGLCMHAPVSGAKTVWLLVNAHLSPLQTYGSSARFSWQVYERAYYPFRCVELDGIL